MATKAQKITYAEVAAPATPAANEVVTYSKADGKMYSKDDAGTETLMSSGAGATRASLGLDTTDSPQFAGLNIGAATDTTITRTGAGDVAVEGNALYRAGGTDVPVTDGGTGASTASAARGNLGALADTDAITYLDGTVASAPATPAAGKLRLYAKTGKVLAVKDDAGLETVLGQGIADQGTVTFFDFTTGSAPSSPAAGKIRVYSKTGDTLAQKTSGGTETVFGSGGGGGISWTQDINESGTSFANFTSGGGTWSSNGTEIIQTDTGGAWRQAKCNTLAPVGFPVILELEAQIITGGGRAGIGLSDGSSGGGLMVAFVQGTGVQFDRQASANFRTISRTVNTSTWYKLRVVMGNSWLSIYVDGTLIANSMGDGFLATADFVCLFSYAGSVKFRNIKVWTLSGGAPA